MSVCFGVVVGDCVNRLITCSRPSDRLSLSLTRRVSRRHKLTLRARTREPRHASLASSSLHTAPCRQRPWLPARPAPPGGCRLSLRSRPGPGTTRSLLPSARTLPTRPLGGGCCRRRRPRPRPRQQGAPRRPCCCAAPQAPVGGGAAAATCTRRLRSASRARRRRPPSPSAAGSPRAGSAAARRPRPWELHGGGRRALPALPPRGQRRPAGRLLVAAASSCQAVQRRPLFKFRWWCRRWWAC